MDPASAFGVVSGAFQVVQIITQTAAGLWSLRERYAHADLTIRSLVGELTTIKSAITQLDDWARLNDTRPSAEYTEYDEGLDVALDGCRVIMEVLSDEVTSLTRGAVSNDSPIGFGTRLRAMWNEDVMKGHQERLRSQVVALQLLLQACQCRSSSEQIELLRRVENRRIIRKVAEDADTLRTLSSYAGSRADTASISHRQFSIVDARFDFDRVAAGSGPYRRALQQSWSRTESPSVLSNENQSWETDEGYASGVINSSPSTSHADSLVLPVRPHESIGNGHSRSVTVRPNTLQANQSGMRRWKSDSTSSTQPTSSLGSKFGSLRSTWGSWRRSNSKKSGPQLFPPTLPENPGPGRRTSRRDLTTSIDFTSIEGSSAPAIVKAAQSGSREDVERLITSGHDIESRHIPTRKNALLVASHCGNEGVVDLLIQKNARLSATDASGWTALHLAAARGHCGVLELLLQNLDIEARTSNGRTALWIAAEYGQVEAAGLLISSNAKVNARADNHMTPLHVAAKAGDAATVELLLSSKADVEAKDGLMMTALHYACEEGHLGTIKALLINKAKVNSLGSDRRTPLICAAAMGQLEATRFLLRMKASDQHADDASMTALHWAAFNGHTEVVDILSQKKDVLAMTNIAGRTALHLAVMRSRFAVVELLLRRKARIEARCHDGLAALHYACMANNIQIARLLLLSGADIEIQTGDQRRPIHIAAASGSMAVLDLLCDKGASLEARDAKDDRALCTACRHGHVAVVQNLLNRGCPLHFRYDTDNKEDSPLCLAAMGGHVPVINVLLGQGASVLKRDEMGWMPYYHAMHHAHPEALRLLLPAELTREQPRLDQTMSRIGFSPANISEARKQDVYNVLRQVQGSLDNTDRAVPPRSSPWIHERDMQQGRPSSIPRPSGLHYIPETNNAVYIPDHDDPNAPQELPGTLEQGLPPSRSHTPEQLNGGIAFNAPRSSSSSVIPRQETSDGPLSWPTQPIVMPQAQHPGLTAPVGSAPPNPLPPTVLDLLEEWSQQRLNSTVSPISVAQGHPAAPVEDSHVIRSESTAIYETLPGVRDENDASDTESIASVHTAPEVPS
ncbi:ankyrin repeat-containing domain protein [Aspergillus ambiguus]|uniref:ankyrin repeat protein n=1 Tax=Aspergillus ambiguus TaxID=176160 RepID=UPI003CCE44EF